MWWLWLGLGMTMGLWGVYTLLTLLLCERLQHPETVGGRSRVSHYSGVQIWRGL